MLTANFPGRKDARRQAAKERQEAYNKLTTKEKLDRCWTFNNQGSKQVKKLAQQLLNENKSSQDGKK